MLIFTHTRKVDILYRAERKICIGFERSVLGLWWWEKVVRVLVVFDGSILFSGATLVWTGKHNKFCTNVFRK